MNEISNIHAFEDEDFLHACFVWGMVVVGVFAVCLVPVFMLLGGPADLDAADAGGWMAVVGWIVGLAAISMASFAVHELVHGVFFKLLAPAGAKVTFGANRETAMIYACAEGVVYSRRRYMAVCLAPTVVVTAALALGLRFRAIRCCATWRPACICRAVWATGITCGPFCATAALSPARIRPLACAFSGEEMSMKPLLLHACCAPCSLEPVRLLREEGFEPTICWTNPNIQPHDEWQRRLDELRRWCADGDIELIEAGEDPGALEAGVAPLGADRARRCRSCYALRLAEACRVAQERGFEFVGTTLAVSPYQLSETCNDVLERLAAARGLTPVIRDFRTYYPEATRRSRELGMYRQNYCGCRFSAVEAAMDRARIRDERKAAKK